MTSNLFDDLGFDLDEAKRIKNNIKERGEHLDYLIHKTFEQLPEGRELLSLWEHALIMQPTANPGDDMLQIGINEGVKQFIRHIKLTVEKIESQGEAHE